MCSSLLWWPSPNSATRQTQTSSQLQLTQAVTNRSNQSTCTACQTFTKVPTVTTAKWPNSNQEQLSSDPLPHLITLLVVWYLTYSAAVMFSRTRKAANCRARYWVIYAAARGLSKVLTTSSCRAIRVRQTPLPATITTLWISITTTKPVVNMPIWPNNPSC